MKKLTIIAIATTTLLSSCGIKFGDYHRYQQVRGNKVMCKVMIDGPKIGYTYKDLTTGKTKKGTDGWQAYQFTN